MHVVEVYNAFKTELSDWFKKDPVRRNDVEVRGDMADYLTDMYLSKKLDTLPQARYVYSSSVCICVRVCACFSHSSHSLTDHPLLLPS